MHGSHRPHALISLRVIRLTQHNDALARTAQRARLRPAISDATGMIEGTKIGVVLADHPTMYFVFSQPDGTLPTATAPDRQIFRRYIDAPRQPEARRASRPAAPSTQTSHDAAFHHSKRRAPWERAKRQPDAASPA